MASQFSQFVLIQWTPKFFGTLVLGFKGDVDGVAGSVYVDADQGMFNPMAKMEVEESKIDSTTYFHLRYSLTNKYLSRNNVEDGFLVAVSAKPEEDKTKPSCTLFQVASGDAIDNFRLVHVQSGGIVDIRMSDGRALVSQLAPERDPEAVKLRFVDADTIVRLPKHVAFKGDNGKYLQGVVVWDHNYLKFDSEDPNANATGFEVIPYRTGHVQIKSDRFGRFWRLSPNWIWADSPDMPDSGNMDETLFWPVKIDEKTIALRNAQNNNFCRRLSAENNYDCLNAAVSTIIKEARLELQELVMERKINNVKYRLDESRIYGEAPYVGGSSNVANHNEKDATMTVEIEYKNEKSYLFGGGVSLTLGVSSTVEAGIPEIAKASVTVSASVTAGLSWGTTESNSVTLKAKTEVPVPAKSSVTVKYVGTKGSCSVPFTYRRQDKSSTDGKISAVEMIDGLFTGVNCYNFNFEVEKAKPLP